MKNSAGILKNRTGIENTKIQNVWKIVVKVLLVFLIIALSLFIAIKISQNKLSDLSKTVSAIIEPSLKLQKLKEISGALYGAEANIRSFSIRRDTIFLVNYRNNISFLNSRLDTLLWLSSEGKIVDGDQAKAKKILTLQIDTLRKLIDIRIGLFFDYLRIKAGKQTQNVLLKLLDRINVKPLVVYTDSVQQADVSERSFLSRLFSSKKDKVKMLADKNVVIDQDSLKKNFRKIIVQAQLDEKIKESKQFSKEIDIAQRENEAMVNIFLLIKSMEDKELAEGVFRIHKATKETTEKISYISRTLMVFGLLLSLILSYFIYLDVMKAKRYKDKIQETKLNAEKLASKYSLSLIEASLDPLVTINAEGKITDMNEATVDITGIAREILVGTDFFDYFTEHHNAREVYRQVFAKGSVTDSPLTIRHVGGKLTEVLFNGSVYKDDTGKVLGVVVVARDITEQRRFENELIEAKKFAESATMKAEESTRLKEAFLANMSHEIRTPMNAIIGFSDILCQREMGEEEKEYVAIIRSAGENLLTIINDILDISKIEAGMMSFENDNFSIKETFKSLKVLLMVKAHAKKLELLFSCDDDVPEVLMGDHTRFTQIILNLAGNAIKFTQKGTVHVHARVLKIENERTFMSFSVKDTGIGIPKDKLEQIFERFRQAESHTTRKYGGTGLGLSIAKQLVELQGGALSVTSVENMGSEFLFYIPYKKSLQVKVTSAMIEKKYNMEDMGNLNILLVEDNQLNVRLILSLFSENRLKVQVAENGKVCIEKLKENIFDLILMDMEMPVMNGYEATNFIRNKLKNTVPIIAMTAHAMSGERERCLSLGMNDYISKPINAILLFEKIHELTIK